MFRRSECHKGYIFLGRNDLPRQMSPAHHHQPWPGRSAVWLACVVRDDEVESSNLSAPTIFLSTPYEVGPSLRNPIWLERTLSILRKHSIFSPYGLSLLRCKARRWSHHRSLITRLRLFFRCEILLQEMEESSANLPIDVGYKTLPSCRTLRRPM